MKQNQQRNSNGGGVNNKENKDRLSIGGKGSDNQNNSNSNQANRSNRNKNSTMNHSDTSNTNNNNRDNKGQDGSNRQQQSLLDQFPISVLRNHYPYEPNPHDLTEDGLRIPSFDQRVDLNFNRWQDCKYITSDSVILDVIESFLLQKESNFINFPHLLKKDQVRSDLPPTLCMINIQNLDFDDILHVLHPQASQVVTDDNELTQEDLKIFQDSSSMPFVVASFEKSIAQSQHMTSNTNAWFYNDVKNIPQLLFWPRLNQTFIDRMKGEISFQDILLRHQATFVVRILSILILLETSLIYLITRCDI
jgi:hypothetical protein